MTTVLEAAFICTVRNNSHFKHDFISQVNNKQKKNIDIENKTITKKN